MNVYEIFDKIMENLPSHPSEANKGYWTNGEVVFCSSEEIANMLCDFFESIGIDIMHWHYYDSEDDGLYRGWYEIYPD